MEEQSRMELQIWGGGWGLPSIDPESIQCLAAVRFGGAPTTVTECNNPWQSPKGLIPFFKQLNGDYCYSSHEVSTYLRSKNYSGDYGLTSIQCAETVAYGQLMWEALHVAYQYYCWVHDGNFSEVIRPFYGRRVPWMYKFWYPDRLRSQAKEIVVSIYRDAESNPEGVEPFILDKAKKCVNLLSQKLATNEFFMSTSSPTTIDAIAFSYLAVFWKVQLLYNPVKEFITANPYLERYLARILQRYFPTHLSVRGHPSSSTNMAYGPDGEILKHEEESQSSAKPKIIAGLAASIIMFLYALKNGIVRIPGNPAIQSSPLEEDDEDYEWE